MPKTTLADRYVEEGLAMDVYPGVIFRDGPAGRRPALLGGPDVWEVIQVLLDAGRSRKATAETLHLRPGLVDAAIAYYTDNKSEIDEWVEANREEGETAAAAFARSQLLTAG
ncbi:MAG: hypothetical protein ACREN8_04220 [Candidatus Dormibacteraceae bacterium]